MSAKRRSRRDQTDERRRVLLAVVDELDAIDEVLGALPSVRRLTDPADALAHAGSHVTVDEAEHPIPGVEDAIVELVRRRLRVVVVAVRSVG